MILAALLEETFVRDFAIGEGNLTPTILINHLLANLKRPFIDVVSKEPTVILIIILKRRFMERFL